MLMYKGSSLYAGHLASCNTYNFWCSVSNIAQPVILTFINIESTTEIVDLDDDLV
jgi:hypothetical protein